MTDLLELTAELVDIPSVSQDEQAITDRIEQELRAVPWLVVDRVGDNLVARTDLDRDQRLVLAGHTDTVPVNGNDRARIDGDTLWGLGAADMKSGLAIMLELAAHRAGAGRRRDVCLLCVRGDRVAVQRSRPAVRCSAGSPRWRRRRPRRADGRGARGRLPGNDAARGPSRRRACAQRPPVDGPQCDPPPRPAARARRRLERP